MKKIVCMLAVFVFTLCACKQENLSYNEKIQFPQMAQELHGDVPFDFSLKNKKEIIGKELSIYKIIQRRNEKNAEYYDGCLFKTFSANVYKTVEYEHYTKYFCNDNDTLEIYDTGSYIFSHNRNSNDIVTLSDDEAIILAEKFLKDYALLPNGFVAGKILGGTYNKNGEPLKKTVGFYHEIDGYEVYGRSDITVEIDSIGINGVYSIYNEYEFEQKVKSLTFDEILDISPLKEGQIIYDATKLSGEVERVVIDDLQIMYYDSPVNQPELTYILPIYKFKGKIYDVDGNFTDYYWAIQAIS